MPMRATRLLAIVAVAIAAVVLAPGAPRAAAADPTPSVAATPDASPDGSPAPTLPPMVGAPGTTTAGTTIRGAIGVLIGAIIVIIGWRRRRRPNPRPDPRRGPGPTGRMR